MAGRIKGITVEIGGDTSELNKALKGTNDNIKNTKSQLKDVERLLKLDPKNTQLLEQKQRLLGNAIGDTKGKLVTLKNAEKQAQEQFKQGNISQEQYQGLQREIISTNQELKRLKSEAFNTNKLIQGIGNVGSSLTKSVTVPIIGAGVAVGKMSVDFEEKMAKVSTIADTSVMPIDKMKESILELSNQTGISSDAIAEDVYNAISAGQKTEEAVNFVTNSTKMAKAGFAESGQALDLLTTIMNSYEMKASDVTKISDILIQTQNKGKTTVGDLSSSMGKIIPTAKSMGVGLEQVATGYAIMTAKGVATAETTTYMNSMFNEMGKNGTTASKALMAMSGKTFPELIASGMSVGDVLSQMSTYASKNHKSLSDMFGSAEAGKAALILSANAGQVFNTSLKDMEKSAGATDAAFAKVNDTTGNKLKKSINELKNDGIKMGDTLAPVILSISDIIKNITSRISSLNEGQRETILKVAGVIAILGPALLAISKISGGIKTTIEVARGINSVITLVKGLGLATKAGTAIQYAFNLAMTLNPIGLVIVAIATLIAAGVLLYKKCVPFRNFINAMFEGIKQGAISVGSKIASVSNGVKQGIDNVRNWFSSGVDKMKKLLNFSWSFPKLKMPHFNVTGKFSLSPPSVPKLGISWYAKAMNKPYILNSPTIFGYGGGRLLGGGEAGSEVVSGTSTLMGMIKDAVAEKKGNQQIINFNGQYKFNDQADIDYFMNQAALRLKGVR